MQRLREAADELRARLLAGEPNADEIASAFALAREAARRHRGLRHFRVQLLGGAVMMSGALAEMQTGEGKSLTALLPAITAALMGRPVHIITVNDYLARRDAEEFRRRLQCAWPQRRTCPAGPAATGPAASLHVRHHLLHEQGAGVRLSARSPGTGRPTGPLAPPARRDFQDQPRRASQRSLLLRGLHFAIVDEADSVLIDEARTPLILSGLQGEEPKATPGSYDTALDIARRLVAGDDFHVLASEKSVRLTEQGTRRISELTSGLPGLWVIRRAREEFVRQALSALHLFHRDVQYIVTAGKVQIVDEYTGRVMPDRSWEHGMHQLIEAKESCAVTQRHQTLARITYQQFFRRYHHLCGMTGTALEAAGELRAVYGLRVVSVPTNRRLRRTDAGTRIFPTPSSNGTPSSNRRRQRRARAGPC